MCRLVFGGHRVRGAWHKAVLAHPSLQSNRAALGQATTRHMRVDVVVIVRVACMVRILRTQGRRMGQGLALCKVVLLNRVGVIGLVDPWQ